MDCLKGRRIEADPQERTQIHHVYFNGLAPEPSLVPLWNRRSPVLRGRGFSMPSNVPPDFVKKSLGTAQPIAGSKHCRRYLEKRGMEKKHWGWLFIALGLIGLGVAIAMVAKMPA